MKRTFILFENRNNSRFAERFVLRKKNKNVSIILMANVLPVHSVTGTIDFPDDIQGRINRATDILAGCDGNSWVTIAGTVITDGQTALTNYTNAVPGNRAGLFKILNDFIQNSLLAPFQAKADSDPINSIAILQSGGFHVKAQHIPQIHQFEVKQGVESGTVELSAAGGPNEDHFHEWMYSADRISWDRLRASNVAHTLVSDLPIGQIAYFTHQLFVKEVGQGLSQIIEIRVN